MLLEQIAHNNYACGSGANNHSLILHLAFQLKILGVFAALRQNSLTVRYADRCYTSRVRSGLIVSLVSRPERLNIAWVKLKSCNARSILSRIGTDIYVR